MDIFDRLSFPEFKAGTVWLVGAGPGDPRLLSLMAVYAIHQADVIIHDALIDPDLLALIPEGTDLRTMGKRGGKPSPKQDEINQELITLARQDKKVMRLKGGDPFVFGRGAEEAFALMDADIPVRIVNGITAGIAGAAAAGVPVSHGTLNQVISFVSAHNPKGTVSELDWKALANASEVIVFYMPLAQIETIAENLLKAGRKDDEAVCFVSRATTSKQAEIFTTLQKCLEKLDLSDIKSPALMIVGSTVGLNKRLKGCF